LTLNTLKDTKVGISYVQALKTGTRITCVIYWYRQLLLKGKCIYLMIIN